MSTTSLVFASAFSQSAYLVYCGAVAIPLCLIGLFVGLAAWGRRYQSSERVVALRMATMRTRIANWGGNTAHVSPATIKELDANLRRISVDSLKGLVVGACSGLALSAPQGLLTLVVSNTLLALLYALTSLIGLATMGFVIGDTVGCLGAYRQLPLAPGPPTPRLGSMYRRPPLFWFYLAYVSLNVLCAMVVSALIFAAASLHGRDTLTLAYIWTPPVYALAPLVALIVIERGLRSIIQRPNVRLSREPTLNQLANDEQRLIVARRARSMYSICVLLSASPQFATISVMFTWATRAHIINTDASGVLFVTAICVYVVGLFALMVCIIDSVMRENIASYFATLPFSRVWLWVFSPVLPVALPSAETSQDETT